MMRKSTGAWVAAALAGLWVLALSGPSRGAVLFPLDREAIFCIYHKLSGEPMADQDIEDLCFALGKPLYSLYKPNEMFVKTGLRERREILLAKLKGYGEAPRFLWTVKDVLKPGGAGQGSRIAVSGEEGMPQPTSYIRSAISAAGRQAVLDALQALRARNPVGVPASNPGIRICLEPEGVDRQFERRIIAQEEVFLPIRRVLFRPVAVRVSLQETEDQERHALGLGMPSRLGPPRSKGRRGVSE